MQKIIINNLNELNQFAMKISKICKKNFYVLLSGDLGAGKTTFTKVLLESLGVKEMVTSPTFIILNQYKSNVLDFKINHMDAYRLNLNEDIEMFEEQFLDSLNIIEWYEKLSIDFKSLDAIYIDLKIIDLDKREITVREGN